VGKVSTIGLDLAKNVFQAHGADTSGNVLFHKKLGFGLGVVSGANISVRYPRDFLRDILG
jgi:hypothetical protein